MKRQALTIVILALALVLVAGVAAAQTSPCAGAPTSSGTTGGGASALEGGGCPVYYLQVLGIVSGILLGVALMTYTLYPGEMKRSKQMRLFKFGLLPTIIFYGQTLFCASAGLLIGCIISALTAPIGLIIGTIFFVYMVYQIKMKR